jgi:hypothetical protein
LRVIYLASMRKISSKNYHIRKKPIDSSRTGVSAGKKCKTG